MKCPKCGLSLPDDSDFCQYCGVNITDYPEPQALQIEKGGNTNEILNNPEENGKCQEKKKRVSTKRVILSFLLLTLGICLFAGLNIYQYIKGKTVSDEITLLKQSLSQEQNKTTELEHNIMEKNAIIDELELSLDEAGIKRAELEQNLSEKETSIANLENTLEERENTITGQKTTISKQQQKIIELSTQANHYNELCSTLRFSNLGYAASNFHSSKSIIVVGSNEKNRQFTLTANWSNGGTVSVSYTPSDNPSAMVEFDNNSWQTSTTMTIIPYHEGISTVTFSNNVDDNTFQIVIIVTE